MIYLNGRFLAAEPTGVQRVAAALIRELDHLTLEPVGGATLLRPEGSRTLSLSRISERCVGFGRGQVWEQLRLPTQTKGSILVNLCNTAPIAHSRNVVMIHDAQVFLSPDSYSQAFRAWYGFLLPTLGRRALRVLTVSNYSKTQLIRFGVASENKITVIPNGCDHISRISPDASVLDRMSLRSTPYILALSSLQAHKNVRILIEAFARPELKGIKPVLAGKTAGADFARIGMHIPDSVYFTGAVDDASLSALMRGAVATATPSLTEGFGLVPLEAMSVGCPVVVSPEGALPEACGKAAIYAEVNDSAQWATSLAELAGSPTLQAVRKAAGLARAAEFTWAASGRRLKETLDAVQAAS